MQMKAVMRSMSDAAVHIYITSPGLLGLMSAICASYLIGNANERKYQNLLSNAKIPERIVDALKHTLAGEKVYKALWKVRELVVALSQICYSDANKRVLMEKQTGVVRMLVDILETKTDDITLFFALRTLVELAFNPAARMQMYEMRVTQGQTRGLCDILEVLATAVSRTSISVASAHHSHDRSSPAINRAKESTCELARMMLYVLDQPLLLEAHASRELITASRPHVYLQRSVPGSAPAPTTLGREPAKSYAELEPLGSLAKRRWSTTRTVLKAATKREKKPYAFVTFSWIDTDRGVAEDICDDLERRCKDGESSRLEVYRCTRFENEPDDPSRILQEIDDAQLMILFVSNNYQESYNCRLQAELAEAAGKPFVFVELEDYEALSNKVRNTSASTFSRPRKEASAGLTQGTCDDLGSELGWLTEMMCRNKQKPAGQNMNLMLTLTNKDEVVSSLMAMFVQTMADQAQRERDRVGDIGYFQRNARGVQLCEEDSSVKVRPKAARTSMNISMEAGLDALQGERVGRLDVLAKEESGEIRCPRQGGEWGD
jgi:hypothetical protein